jgi:hypothetical protein
MTVISAVISRFCTAHASDSLITERQPDGSYRPTEYRRAKIIAVRQWRGAMAYWGLATYGPWSTFDWLRDLATSASNFSSPQDFAYSIMGRLNTELSGMRFQIPTNGGLGIHFTAYEHVNDYWIPELFLISNWTDPSYSAVRPAGFGVSRETYHTIANEPSREEHASTSIRLQVHAFLQEGKMLIYNNGDPLLFRPAANSVSAMLSEIARRGHLKAPEDIETYRSIARRPIEVVANAQLDFYKPGARIVGGKLHDLAITPDGLYSSSTGDAN